MPRLDHIRVVLVRTFHPGNIGSSARAMNTMGLTNLHLVDPWYFPDDEATKMATHAAPLLEQATQHSVLNTALAECKLVVACTARARGFDRPELTPEQAAKMLTDAAPHNVALMFGPERNGLSNEHISMATHRMTIPTNPECSSLNLASAVQIAAYELRKAVDQEQSAHDQDRETRPAIDDIERLYTHIESTYRATGFIKKSHPGHVMDRIRRLYHKAELTQMELNILRGMLRSVDRLLPDQSEAADMTND
ncbi:MAG: RNA methyltransferase [Gammaproteobacteria bacterium]|nr:RNA methyltransferase [Gammaproteobacteria bacterium]